MIYRLYVDLETLIWQDIEICVYTVIYIRKIYITDLNKFKREVVKLNNNFKD